MRLSASWPQLQRHLTALAEGGMLESVSAEELGVLGFLGLVQNQEDGVELTQFGEHYYKTSVVLRDSEKASSVLQDGLLRIPVVQAFCSALWGTPSVPIDGALSLIRRLTRCPEDLSARRWLELLGRAKLISYNRRHPDIRVLVNPSHVLDPIQSGGTPASLSYVIRPDQPFGNRRALRRVIETARGWIAWYEQHMPPKVLEVLYDSLSLHQVTHVRLLSGTNQLKSDTGQEFKRFRNEMLSLRGITVEWRTLDRNMSRAIHDRILLTEGISLNLPPLNLILSGSMGEILPSSISLSEFEKWWELGVDLLSHTSEDTI